VTGRPAGPRPSRGGDGGFSALEIVILVPVIFALLGLIVFGGRRQAALNDVSAAAQTAARTISIARDPEAARTQAQADAAAILQVGSTRCTSMDFAAVVAGGQVDVTVTCQVQVADLAVVLPLPGSVPLQGRASEVLDRFREGS
jgi:Flp pilus assembly protein TadG